MTTNAESTAPVETAEVDSKAVSTGGEGTAPSGTEAAASGDDTSSWTEKAQKRYDELTRERYEAAARADREAYRREQAERERDELRRQVAESAKTPQVAPVDEYPTLESCGFDEAEHRRRVSEYFENRVQSTASNAVEKRLAAERAERAQREALTSYQQREADFIKSKPDYVEKVTRGADRGDWECTVDMAKAIRRSDIGPEIAYYLAEQPDKASVIARLDPDDQRIEIGRIAGRIEAIKASVPPPVSKAPPPAPRLTGVETVDEKDPSNMSDAEFAKWRRRQIAQRR
jgi:hypothetical protein